MGNLEWQYQELLNAYKRLEHILIKLHKARLQTDCDEDDILAYRDSVIKRFEFSYDLTWKFLKTYLEITFSITALSPKKVFRECFDQNILDEQETQQFLDMVDDRNLTAHTYSEDMSEQISLRIISYYETMHTALKRIYNS
jgi:nucleotidyltransferase substrate binding protein (TIGR01987 family)